MQIGELARRSGASQKAVRLYDRPGLIVGASRSPSNYRLFDEDAVWCVRGIRALQAAGLTCATCRTRLQRDVGAAARTLLQGKAEEVLTRIDRELTELHQRRQRLLALRSDVDAYLQPTA
jgi:DNA-binding transcriptional MerR regulator